MLYEGGVNRCRGYSFAQARCAMGVRETLRNTMRPERGASLTWGARIGRLDGCDQPRVVTDGGHIARSPPGYPSRISTHRWIPDWIPTGFDPMRTLATHRVSSGGSTWVRARAFLIKRLPLALSPPSSFLLPPCAFQPLWHSMVTAWVGGSLRRD